ncbi:lipopolysaccharide biosynthesis protein [Aquipuribacter sp. SD81]|uniref:lipopolysaccharide biosynthesis protein n=1 Tax=Aquipuribacter sp. SD81 TaxID=3127703 RepID=UPI003016892B
MPRHEPAGGLRQRVLRGGMWSVAEALGSRIITTVVFLLLARLLDPEAFGLVALALVFVALTRLLVDQGFGSAIVQRQQLTKAHLDTAFWTSIVLGLLLGALLIALSHPLAALLDSPGLAPVLQVLASVVFIGSLTSTATAVLRRDFQFHRLAARKLAGAVIGGVAGVAAALLGAGVWALVVQAVVQTVVGTVMLWAVTSYRPGLTVSRSAFRDLFGFSNSVLGMTMLNFLSKRSDDLLIGAVLGPTALGLYSVAYRLLNLMNEVLTRAVELVALSAFSRLQHDLARLNRAYGEAIRTSAALSAPSFLLVLVLAPDVVHVFLGDQWLAAVPVMQALSLAGIAHALGATTTTLLLSQGRSRTALHLTTATTVLNVVGFLVAVSWGIVAVALAHTVRAFVMLPVSAWLSRRILGFRWRSWLGHLAPALGSAVLMAGVVEVLRRFAMADAGAPTRLLVLVPLAALVYAGALRLLSPAQFRALVGYARTVLTRGAVRAAATEETEPARDAPERPEEASALANLGRRDGDPDGGAQHEQGSGRPSAREDGR